MNKLIGFSNTAPQIKSVRFPKGKIVLYLIDERIIILPINRFPEIEGLTPVQKRRYKTLAGMGLMFDDIDTVFHISDFLGKDISVDHPVFSGKDSKKYTAKKTSHSKAAEPHLKYGKE